jgi:polyisoprenoid-binding protein YceI
VINRFGFVLESGEIMRRTPVIVALVALLVVIIAGYFLFFNDPEPVENKLPTATPAPEAAVYGFDTENSELKFTIETEFGDIKGTFKLTGGTIVKQPAADGGFNLIANVIIDGNSVDTGNRLINFAMRQGLKADTFPYGVFTGDSTTTYTSAAEPIDLTLSGNIELSGITNPIEVPIQFQEMEDGSLTVSADIQINMEDFKVSFPEQIGSNILNAKLNIIAREDLAPVETPTVQETPSAKEITPVPTDEDSSPAPESTQIFG